MLDVTVVLLDDGLSSTAIVPVEIFHAAGALWNLLHGKPEEPRFRVRTVSLKGAAVRSPYGIGLQPEASLADVDHTDLIIVPTSGLEFEPKLIENSALLPWLRRHYDQGAYVAGVCMGAAYLAEAGLLDGRIATTHWAINDQFVRRYPQVRWRSDLFVTEDARVLCSGGVYAAMDLALYLVEKFCGHETALETARALLLPMPRTHQCGYAMLPVSRPHDDDRVRAVEDYLHAHFRADVSTAALADRAGLAARTFVRRFKSATGKQPAAYVQALRVEAAKGLLERGVLGVQAVSSEVGYDDVAFFRTLFKRATGMTPGQYRAQFAPMTVQGAVEVPTPVPAS